MDYPAQANRDLISVHGRVRLRCGSSGNNVTSGSGATGAPNGTMPTNNGHGDGSVVTNEHVYAPTFVGGSGGPSIDPSNGASNGSVPSQPGSYTNPDTGTSNVPLDNVSAAAQAQADSAMDTDHVPIGLRGVIHDYFSGLQPATSP